MVESVVLGPFVFAANHESAMSLLVRHMAQKAVGLSVDRLPTGPRPRPTLVTIVTSH